MAITKVTNSLVSVNAIHGTLIADNAITSVHIAQNQVTAVQIPDSSITAVQLAGTSVGTGQLVNVSVTEAKIANNAVTSNKIATNSVVTETIAQNSITAVQIPDGSITDTQLGSGAFTMGTITTTGQIRGPASLTLDPATVGDNTGTVVIAGNLQVDGTTTTVNSTTLNSADKNITLGFGGSASANNGGGITIAGASATLVYNHSDTSWQFNKPTRVISSEFSVSSGASYTSHFNYQNGGNNILSQANGGSTAIRNNVKTLFTVGSAGDVTIADGIFTSIHDITTINKFKTTNNNTRSTLSLESKDSSGNAVDLRMHTAGDGPRAEVFTFTNHDLAFSTNNAAPQMILKTSGNFGIGVTDPDTSLEVNIKNGADGNGIHITSTSTTNDPTLKLTRNGSADRFQFMVRAGAGAGRLAISAGTGLDAGLNLGANNGLTIGATTAAGAGGLLVDNDIKTNSRFGVGSGGSLADAAIYRNSDANTGIYWPAADTLGFTTAGSEKIRIGSDGAVTLKPSGITTGLRLQGRSSDNNFFIQFRSNDGNSNYASIGSLSSGGLNYQTNTHIFTNEASNHEHMRITDGGEIGIGTAAPKATLDIKPDNNSWEGGLLLQHDNANTGWNLHPERGGNALWFGYNSNTALGLEAQDATETVVFTGDGKVGIGDATPPSTLTVLGTNTADVASNGAGINGLHVTRTTSSGENLYMYMTDGNAAGSSWTGIGNVGKIESYGNNAFEIGSQQNIPVVIGQNNTQKIKIKGDITTHAKFGSTYIESLYTPNGGVQNCRIFEDHLGKWIAIGYFAADAKLSIQTTWGSVRGAPTGLGQSETTVFSADWGDSYPTEVRYLGATDFSNFQETKTIDFIHGVPRGRPWKQFFNNAHRIPDGGTSVSSSLMGTVQGPVGSVKNGWECRGAYDGRGRWHNPSYTHHRMSDATSINCADTAFTTPTSSHFNWEAASDAKISVHNSLDYSGQDGITSAAFGNDDNIVAFFDDYPTNRSNFGGTANNYTSAVYVLMKLPEMQSIGLEGGRARDHQPGEVVQTKLYERGADVSATSGLTGELGHIDFTPLYGNSLLEFNVHANTGTNSAGSVFWQIYQGSPSAVGTLIRRTGNQIVAAYDQAADGHPLPFSWTQYYQLNDDKKSSYRYRVRFTPSGATYWGHTYGSTARSYFTIKEIKQEHDAKGIMD